MAPHSSTLPGKFHGWRSLVGCSPCGRWESDTTSLSLFPFMHWRRKWQPTPVFLPAESQGRGSLVAAICGVAQSRTRLKRLSSSSSSGSDSKDSACNAGDVGSIPGPGRSPGEQPPVFLPGKFHGQRSLAGYCPWGCKELDTTKRT